MLDRLCWRRRLAVRIVAAFLCLSALPSSKGFAGPIEHQGDLAESNAPVSPGPFVGTEPSILALYKTITYTATVLTTDQIWYMGIAEKAEDTGGLFGIVNTITSPLLTYAFEYTWERCCEEPPGPDGVRPVDPNKAILYRLISMTRTFTLALLFGNELGASALMTVAISTTRTVAYVANDMIWNRLTSSGKPEPTAVAMVGK